MAACGESTAKRSLQRNSPTLQRNSPFTEADFAQPHTRASLKSTPNWDDWDQRGGTPLQRFGN
jgi:hypothetical protein